MSQQYNFLSIEEECVVIKDIKDDYQLSYNVLEKHIL